MMVFGISLIFVIVARMFCGNHLKVISLQQTASAVFVDFGPVLPLRERKNLNSYNCIAFTNF